MHHRFIQICFFATAFILSVPFCSFSWGSPGELTHKSMIGNFERDCEVVGLSSIEVYLAAAERTRKLERQGPVVSLGETLDNALSWICQSRFDPASCLNCRDLITKTQFFQSLILQSERVGVFRKSQLKLFEAKELLNLFPVYEQENALLEKFLDLLKTKLQTQTECDALEHYYSDWVSHTHTISAAGEKIRALTSSLKLIDSFTVDDLGAFIRELPTQQVKPHSEKELLSVRDLIREFTGNDKWTASDLLMMDMSLNDALLIEAVGRLRSTSTDISQSTVQSQIEAQLASSSLHDITENPLKPKMKSPQSRSVSMDYIRSFIFQKFKPSEHKQR